MTFNSLPDGYTAAVFGASGGIGAALVAELAADPRCVIVRAGSRRGGAPAGEKILPFAFDLADTASIARAAETVGTPDLVIVATGIFALWWMTIQPSNDRDWQPDVAQLLTAAFDPDDPSRVVLRTGCTPKRRFAPWTQSRWSAPLPSTPSARP